MAIKANLIIDQGADYETSINVTDDDDAVINLTGYTGAAQMRKHYTSVSYYSFNVSISGPQGIVTLTMSSNTSASIPAGRYVYDCELTDTQGKTSRLVEGIVTITPNVTR